MKLCTAEQMRALEAAAVAEGTPLDALMEQAGLAVAQEAWLHLGIAAGRRILVLVGPGNNGGDGLVAARHLADFDADVCVYLTSSRDDEHVARLRERDVRIFVAGEDPDLSHLDEALAGAEAVIDALLGTGHARPLDGTLAAVLDRLAARRTEPLPPKLIAVDLPTGVDAGTGAADPHAVAADLTVTLGVAKVGLHTLPGSDLAGQVEVIDIGLPAEALHALPLELLDAATVRGWLPARPRESNKGTFGDVLVVAGSHAYVGAVRLAAEACYRAGAGLVRVACPPAVRQALAASMPESTWLPVAERDGMISADALPPITEAASQARAVLIGPGLGRSTALDMLVPALLRALPSGVSAVVDADALNALAEAPDWCDGVAATLVLTPHPGEMARLTGRTTEAVQAARLALAVEMAQAWGHVVALKGAHTVVAAPDGRAAISPHATPLLATAGTGDVLAGVIAGLLAQGTPPFEAAAAGVYTHGLAATECAESYGDRGMLASELLPAIPRALQTVIAGRRATPPQPSALAGLAGLAGQAGLDLPDFGSLLGR